MVTYYDEEVARVKLAFFTKGRAFTVSFAGLCGEPRDRHFIVMRPQPKAALCVEATSYHGRATTAAAGVNADEHAAMVFNRKPVQLRVSEKPLKKKEISVRLEGAEPAESSLLRIDFGRIWVIGHEHRVRVVGTVEPEYMARFESHFMAQAEVYDFSAKKAAA
ncbi:hypothetical protein BDV95DRAFT_610645 [Massariosphaeria phaeospora]|uniref:DUF6590 domain-containing protein n=1 Tax=Massariosphaeria phaeospora TaxID=100035 RepID=A0A7C8M460_9PLEO|nr:hypothetical protein BDV95DRAFT_610645 [Massariosphaeria phaeospora]